MARVGPVPLILPALDAEAADPLHRQLYHLLRAAILEGRIRTGAQLPSSRQMAAQLGISRNTVVAAFDQLIAEGYVESRQGSGTRVAVRESLGNSVSQGEHRKARPVSRRIRQWTEWEAPISRGVAVPFALGIPALDAFPFREWSRLLARRWRRPTLDVMLGRHEAGYPPLREAIAEHLRLVRGLRCTAEQVVIVSGSQQGLELAVRVLLEAGDLAMVEDPGYNGLKGVLRAAGAVLAPVPVDEAGFDPVQAERLWPTARLACVTPSHQFPSGATMPAHRRLALIEWAARTGGWIVEDDYDSDFRYGGHPLEALQGLDRDNRTIYCGTFSKSMFPGLRLGWLVVPTDLLPAITAVHRLAGAGPSTLIQAAMADFMLEGLYAAHLRRSRALYGERRQAVLAAAAHLAELAEVVAGEAGTHAIAWLSDGCDDGKVAQAAGAQGLAPAALGRYRLAPGRPGLILGYGHMLPEGIASAMKTLATVLR